MQGTCPDVLLLIFLVTSFSIVFCMKDSRLIAQYAIDWVLLTFPGTGINVNLTCLQTVCIYPVDRQALICTYCWYDATDFDTLRMSCLILLIITVLDFNVYILWKTCGLCISIVPSNEIHLQLWVKWHTEGVFKSRVPRECLNFGWNSCMSLY